MSDRDYCETDDTARWLREEESINDKAGLTDVQKDDLAKALHIAWSRYVVLLGEHPHGTLKQLRALVEFIKLDTTRREGVAADAGGRDCLMCSWYAPGKIYKLCPECAARQENNTK